MVVVLMLAASPVLADTELGHSGKVGRHHLVDTTSSPGVTCQYENSPSQPLTGIHVRAPVVRARNVTAHRDHQLVGWRYIILRVRGNTESTYFKSPISKLTAYDDKRAPFEDGATDLMSPAQPGDLFYVNVKMFWYRGGKTEGTALHEVDHYVEVVGATPPAPVGGCASGYLN